MSVVAAALEQARAVKDQLAARLEGQPAVNGVGLARASDHGWVVKVNLARAAPELDLPPTIDGVPVWTEIVGRIVAR